MGKRQFWFPLADMYHNLYRSLDWQTIGSKGGDFALTAPGWQGVLPDGMGRIEMTTPMMWTLGRITVNGVKDVPAVNALQDKTFLVPLSQSNITGESNETLLKSTVVRFGMWSVGVPIGLQQH